MCELRLGIDKGRTYHPELIPQNELASSRVKATAGEIFVLIGQGVTVTIYSIHIIGITSVNLTAGLRKPYDKPVVSLNIARQCANA